MLRQFRNLWRNSVFMLSFTTFLNLDLVSGVKHMFNKFTKLFSIKRKAIILKHHIWIKHTMGCVKFAYCGEILNFTNFSGFSSLDIVFAVNVCSINKLTQLFPIQREAIILKHHIWIKHTMGCVKFAYCGGIFNFTLFSWFLNFEHSPSELTTLNYVVLLSTTPAGDIATLVATTCLI